MKKLLTLLFAALWAALSAQSAAYRPGEMIVRLEGDADIKGVVAHLRNQSPSVYLKKAVAADWRIYLLGFDPVGANPAALLSAARRTGGVDVAQWNYEAIERTITPSDSLWISQRDMVAINAPLAWDFATGGLTPQGDTIVVAILEKGVYINHSDLRGNMWVNWGEIPNDGKDNDGNGYADDRRGWNPRYSNDSLGDIGFHGTAVTGIVGATSNNIKGVAGLNWKVKLLNIANVQFEDEIISAYQYVFKQRRLYNQSQGKKGAFIVSSNASFGLNDERADDHKIWCALYDSLGSVGVLTAGATTNRNIDVDIAGDMPTSCPSDYLISVTNVDARSNVKVEGAGFGRTTIDLGAVGEGTYTTRYDNKKETYGNFPGTSAAAPHVAGAVALIYSFPCAEFTADAISAPATCARRVRDLIFKSAIPTATLSNTVTGSRLDLKGATEEVRFQCNGSSGPLSILSLRPNPTADRIRLYYETPDFGEYTVRVFNMLGQLMHEETVTPPQLGRKTYEFDASDLPAGCYAISIGRDKKVETRIFVKK